MELVMNVVFKLDPLYIFAISVPESLPYVGMPSLEQSITERLGGCA
jgi:hypothetical protein